MLAGRCPHWLHTGAGARPVRGLAVRLGRHALLMRLLYMRRRGQGWNIAPHRAAVSHPFFHWYFTL